MDRDDVLRLSREENQGRPDEREASAYAAASRVAGRVGMLACVLLAFAGALLLRMPEVALAGWIVCFAMQGGGNIALYARLQSRKALAWGVAELALAVAFATALALTASGA